MRRGDPRAAACRTAIAGGRDEIDVAGDPLPALEAWSEAVARLHRAMSRRAAALSLLAAAAAAAHGSVLSGAALVSAERARSRHRCTLDGGAAAPARAAVRLGDPRPGVRSVPAPRAASANRARRRGPRADRP